ncbi:hypothetical protein R3P38DRAFT_3228610 [Favolaschia claudopus]|uniref:Uncharacterized protein n=1 Tax=Favolaschia claudopus TaxID=2862362 RepID=A0AAV9ZQ89_9AGAR
MPRAEPTTPSRRRAARPPLKLARTAASVAAAAAASASSPPLASTSISASAPPLRTTKTKTPKKSKTNDTTTLTSTWRHPAELPYIRSPSTKRDDGGSGKWDDIAIVRFLVAKAGFSIPPRATSPSEEFFQVHFPGASASSSAPGVGGDGGDEAGDTNGEEKKGKIVTLPTPYRLPLLWTAKYLWTSLHLVLTADPAIREQEWRETRFEILHLARLIDALVGGASRRSGDSSSSALPSRKDEVGNAERKGEETMDPAWRCPPFDRALRRFWHHWLISRDEFVRDFWREFGEEEFQDGDVLGLGESFFLFHGPLYFLPPTRRFAPRSTFSFLLLRASFSCFRLRAFRFRFGICLVSHSFSSNPFPVSIPSSAARTPFPSLLASSPNPRFLISSHLILSHLLLLVSHLLFGFAYLSLLFRAAWPRWVLKGHKGFLLTKAEVSNGITVEGFLRGFWVGRGEFGYPEAGESKNDEPEGDERDKKEKPNANNTPFPRYKIYQGSTPGPPLYWRRRARRSPAPTALEAPSTSMNANSAEVDSGADAVDGGLGGSIRGDGNGNGDAQDEMPVDPAVPHPHTEHSTSAPASVPGSGAETPTTPIATPIQKMYVEVPPLAADDPRRDRGRRSMAQNKAALSSTAMGSVRPGQRTGRVVGFAADGGEDEDAGDREEDEDENAEKEDAGVSMEADGEEEGIAKAKKVEDDESDLNLDSDLELGYPDEVESTPPIAPRPVDAPSERETENPNDEDKDISEPSVSRSVSPVLPPLSSARFPPPAPPPTVPSASTPPTQPPPQLTPTPPPTHPPNPTQDALTHFLHSFTALTTELHALRAEVADLRRSRDLTTPVVLQLEERVRRVEGRMSASGVGNSSSILSRGDGVSGVRGDELGVGGRKGEEEGESASAWSHPLAHLVSLSEGDNAMDVDGLPAPQTVVEEGKSSKKRRATGGASGSGGKKRNTTASGDKTAEAGSSASARKVGRR